jgi:hypothetical protein
MTQNHSLDGAINQRELLYFEALVAFQITGSIVDHRQQSNRNLFLACLSNKVRTTISGAGEIVIIPLSNWIPHCILQILTISETLLEGFRTYP